MVDLRVLDAMGSTKDRLREVYTAKPFNVEEKATKTEDEIEAREQDCKRRQLLEEDIGRKLAEQIGYSMQNFQMYSAVDLAWDSAPINKETVPLLLYAQGKLDLGRCAEALKDCPRVERYVTKDDKGNITQIDLPKFFEVNFNFIRSVVTRRLAAQANKYQSLYPNYKYEARSTSQVGKLRADVLSQVMDIMTDQFDLRHHDVQVMRDSMLYGHCVDFARAQWERYEQTIFDSSVNPELQAKGEFAFKNIITKEGVGWVNPHPTRVFWDNQFPLSSINTDTGGSFIGFWDVARYGDVAENPLYWNRKEISYSSSLLLLFATYAQYFTQYQCTITPPCDMSRVDLSQANDRLNNLGLYAQSMPQASLILANYYRKIVPKDHGIGKYPHKVWLRQVVAGANTCLYAEFMPSAPACVCSINENDARQLNISIAMELMPYQDQMTQLLSLLMMTIQSSNLRVLCIDTDSASPEQIKDFRAQALARNRFNMATVFEYSGNKMADRGVDVKKIISMVETSPSQAITAIFTAMAELVKLAERLMALSPQELGQPAPSGISATETNLIGATTETMYGFISDAIDEFRSAKKRILYESYMVCGAQNFRVPVINRYTKKTIAKAGFTILDEDDDVEKLADDEANYHTLLGNKSVLQYEYIFTSRDGALRAVNTQSANVLTQLIMGLMQNPMVAQAIPKEKFFDILNEIFRLSGAGVDLNLELEQSDQNQIGPDKQAQLEQLLQQITQHLEQNAQETQQNQAANQQLEQKFEELIKIVDELTNKVKEIDAQPPAPDPLQVAQTAQKMQIDQQQSDMKLALGAQKMHHAAANHLIDANLKLLAPATETT